MLTKVTPTARERFVREHGFQVFSYSGRMKDSPVEIKHLMREARPGWYAANLETRVVFGPFADFEEANGEGTSWRLAFYRIAFAELEKLTYRVFNEADGWYYSKLGNWLGRGAVQQGPYSAIEFAIEDAAIHAGLLDGYATWSAAFVPTQEHLNVAAISSQSGAYGLFTPQGVLVGTVVHGLEYDLGQPAHDAVLFSNALLLLEFVSAVSKYDGTLDEVKAEAQRIVENITMPYGGMNF